MASSEEEPGSWRCNAEAPPEGRSLHGSQQCLSDEVLRRDRTALFGDGGRPAVGHLRAREHHVSVTEAFAALPGGLDGLDDLQPLVDDVRALEEDLLDAHVELLATTAGETPH